MTEQDIQTGAKIATAVIFFALNHNTQLRGGDLRRMIRDLFGPEVMAHLEKQFARQVE